MADNVYQTDPTSAATPAAQIPGGASDSPFAFGGDPNAPGMLGMSRGFWRDIASFSANLGAAANARTAGGFLANGTGFAGPLAAATQETLAQGQKNATAQSALNQSSAVTQGQTLANQKLQLELQLQRAKNPWIIQQYQNGNLIDNGSGLTGAGANGAGGNTGQPGASVTVPPEVSGAFKTLEGGSPTASTTGLNQLGYAGNYQMGAAALTDAGLYQPAKGEDVSKNQWQGKITVPGFDPMSVQDFINNPKAQDAAFGIHMGNLAKRGHDLGLDTFVGQTIGGVQVTPETIAAMEHFAGPAGTLRFLQSGGTFNPKDANGMHVSDFANKVTAALGNGYKSPPGWFLRGTPAAAETPATAGTVPPTGTTGATPTVTDTGSTTVGSAAAPTTAGTLPATAAPAHTGGATVGSTPRPYQIAQAIGGQPQPQSGAATTSVGGAPPSQQVGTDVNAIVSGMQQGRPETGDPTQVAQNGGTNPYAVHPGDTQPPQAPPGYVSPQQATQRALYLRGLAQRQALAGLSEMSTQTNQQAQQLEQYAQQQLITQSQQAQEQTRQQTAPQSGRGPGSFVTYIGEDGKRKILQSPIEREITGPDRRKYMITLNSVDTGEPYVRPDGVPGWAPNGTLTMSLKDISDAEKEAIKEASQQAFGPEAAKEYRGAANSVRTLEDMEYQFRNLNVQPGGWNTGPGLEHKAAFARALNTVSNSLGGGDIFDPAKVASVEDVIKNSKLLGMDVLTQRFGGNREAASIVQTTQQSVPNVENSPLGGKLLLNGYKEAARYVMDMRAFETNWFFTHNGNMIGADIAFTEAHPPQGYANRAISQAMPFEVKGDDDSEIAHFSPGTKIYSSKIVDPKTGKPVIKTIPGDVGVRLQVPQTMVPGGINPTPPGLPSGQ